MKYVPNITEMSGRIEISRHPTEEESKEMSGAGFSYTYCGIDIIGPHFRNTRDCVNFVLQIVPYLQSKKLVRKAWGKATIDNESWFWKVDGDHVVFTSAEILFHFYEAKL